jgi:Arc/MetJ-type ribon-helix-helix transcriptional regulator
MTVQVAAKLPDELIRRVDELVSAGTFPSRSSAIRQGLESLLGLLERQALDDSVRQGYTRRPESPEEMDGARRLAERAIADEPWERWW